MRCHDVKLELAQSSKFGELADSSELAAHLATCPACAAWSRRDAVLAQLWDATRPVEPADVWTGSGPV